MKAEKTKSIFPENPAKTTTPVLSADTPKVTSNREKVQAEVEIGGPSGPEPTRYGDWEKGGRCTDF